MRPDRFKQFTGLHYSHTKRDWIVFAVSIPPMAILFNFLAFGAAYFLSARKFIIATFITIVLVFFLNKCFLYLAYFWRRKFPEIGQTRKRYIYSILSYIFLSVTVTSTVMLLYNSFHFMGYTFRMSFFWTFLIIIIFSHIAIGGLYEFFYTLEKWKEEIQQKERLEKEKLRSELAMLKSQVNPHFLFNTLNTLSSLVNEHPEKAEDFIDEMSRVYRYLLRNNEEEMSSLADELKFIKSYFHLLKTRYGNGIEMDVRITPDVMDFYLPPLTLQLLIENAVKHNIIKHDMPLRIEIFTENELLTVRNKLQRKTANIHSSRVGLSNIAAKYKLLNREGVLVTDDGYIFSVQVPLIGASVK